MNENQKYTKPGWGKRVLYFILLLFTMCVYIGFSVGTIISIRVLGLNVKLNLLEERSHAFKIAYQVLSQRMHAPVEKLAQMKLPRDNNEAAALALEYPEITEINIIKADGKYSTLFTAARSIEIHDAIAKTAPIVADTFSFFSRYTNIFAETPTKYRMVSVNTEAGTYVFAFVEVNGETRIVVSDPEKLKPQLTEIFNRAEKLNPIIHSECFKANYRYAAQLKLYDRSGENFFTRGSPQRPGWDDVYDIELNFLPWRMTIQLFPMELYLNYAEATDKWPWGVIIVIVIGFILIILLGHFSPRLHGFSQPKIRKSTEES